MKIIGLCGAIGAGKSSAARHLISRHSYRPVSFAHALKTSVLCTLGPLGMEYRHVFGSQADKAEPIPSLGGRTGREFLERVGTEGYRAVWPLVWISLALSSADESAKLVFEDVRYLNEAQAIRDKGGAIVRIERIDYDPPRTGHTSDNEWREIEPDYVVRALDLDSLRAKLNYIIGCYEEAS